MKAFFILTLTCALFCRGHSAEEIHEVEEDRLPASGLELMDLPVEILSEIALQIGNPGFLAIIQALQINTTLETLYLRGNAMKQGGFEKMIQSIVFEHENKLDSFGLKEELKHIPRNRTLKKLYLTATTKEERKFIKYTPRVFPVIKS